MNTFRKDANSGKKPTAVDGFVGGGAGRKSSVRQNRASQLQQSKLDNFSGRDGFRANAQPLIKSDTRTSARTATQVTAINSPGKLELPHSPAARDARTKKRKFKPAVKFFGILFAVLLIAGGVLLAKGYLSAKNIFQGGGEAPALSENVDPTRLKGEGDGRVNILLLGYGGSTHEGAELTDTILIASVDPVQKTASLLSIPRDLWVKNGSGYSKINQVYVDAKNRKLASLSKSVSDRDKQAEQAAHDSIEKTIEDTVGVPIHYYVMVDFFAFEQAINTVGGIDINVKPEGVVYERLWDTTRGKPYTLDVKEGPNHFDGQRALFYSRSRKTSANGDFSRAERQRAVIIALKEKIMSKGTYGNPAKINELINNFGSHVRSNMTTSDLARLYEIGKAIDSTKISSLGLDDYVTTGRSPNGLSIVHPKAGLTNYNEVKTFVRTSLKDSFLLQENASVAVYNATSQNGLATTKADELKSFGYTVTTVANAPTKTTGKTVIVDRTNGAKKYTKHYLEQRLGVSAVTAMPDATIEPGTADFVIILGSDATTR